MKRICQNCEYANEYIPSYIYPHLPPKCSIYHKSVSPTDTCAFFKRIGGGKKMKLKYDNGVIIDSDVGKEYNVNDNVDMEILCNDINKELYDTENELKEYLSIIKDIQKRVL